MDPFLNLMMMISSYRMLGSGFSQIRGQLHSPFDIVHCDIWGPYHVVSYTGHNYFLTLVDDCTRFTWVYLLKQKSDAAVAIPRFFNIVAT